MMNSLRSVVSIALLLLLAARSASADDLPKRPDFVRYSGMLNRSPFAVATAVAVPAATPTIFRDLYVGNAGRLAGEDIVTVQSSSDKALKEYLTTKGPNDDGYAIANIEWSDRPGATKVTISKDGQFATLSFNQALMASAPPPGAPGPTGVVSPGAAPAVPGYVPPAATPSVPGYVPPKPASVPAIPTPPPHVRGVIQRNPGATVPPRPSMGDQSTEQ
jgi:hypothetical protein